LVSILRVIVIHHQYRIAFGFHVLTADASDLLLKNPVDV